MPVSHIMMCDKRTSLKTNLFNEQRIKDMIDQSCCKIYRKKGMKYLKKPTHLFNVVELLLEHEWFIEMKSQIIMMCGKRSS